jgi:hypothetical protein
VARSRGQKADYALNAIAVEVAEREAAEGGFRGVLRDELDCLLCDEVSDPQPLSRLLNRPLRALDEAVAAAVEAALEADRTA